MNTGFAAELLEPPELLGDDPQSQTQAPPPEARLLGALVRSSPGNDPNELLRHRFLCRGGGLLLVGPTGIGKSSFGMQCAILWALGRDCFGIAPAQPLKSLLIQAENDDCDIAEMRDGVIAGLNFSPEDATLAKNSILVCREDSKTSTRFFAETVAPLLKLHKPDLLWIDPALAYIGGESSSQTDVGAFLRTGLNPLVHEFNCGVIVTHHTNKPPTGTEKPSWKAGDFAYLGGGSAEWANWARAVLAIRSVGSHDIFELMAAKRGSRLGWSGPDGSKAYSKLIAHAKEPGVICWRTVDPSEVEPVGRPKSYDPEDLFDLLPPEGLTAGEWQQLCKSEYGIKETTFHINRRAFLKADRVIKSKLSNKWQPVSKR